MILGSSSDNHLYVWEPTIVGISNRVSIRSSDQKQNALNDHPGHATMTERSTFPGTPIALHLPQNGGRIAIASQEILRAMTISEGSLRLQPAIPMHLCH